MIIVDYGRWAWGGGYLLVRTYVPLPVHANAESSIGSEFFLSRKHQIRTRAALFIKNLICIVY
jgi:hypothetical protein